MTFQKTYETINMEALRNLKPATIAEGCRVDEREEGSCCFMDPPGHPSYFVKHVYNGRGNEPARGSTMVLCVPGEEMREIEDSDGRGSRESLLNSLYKRLPFEHPRVQAWVSQVFGYFKDCYHGLDGCTEAGRLRVHAWVEPWTREDTVDILVMMHGKATEDVLRETREGAEKREKDSLVYPPEQYRPISYIREWYPEFCHYDYTGITPEVLKGTYGTGGDWWEQHTCKPTVEECDSIAGGKGHHVEGNSCQFCGWGRK